MTTTIRELFWEKINKIRIKKASTTIPTLIKGNKEYETCSEKANLFAVILKDTFSDQNDPIFDNNFKEKVESFIKSRKLKTSVSKNIFTIDELNGVIKKLKLHTATGSDNIHNIMIKNSNNNFKNIIVQLINLTAESGKLPQCWKEYVITMIP